MECVNCAEPSIEDQVMKKIENLLEQTDETTELAVIPYARWSEAPVLTSVDNHAFGGKYIYSIYLKSDQLRAVQIVGEGVNAGHLYPAAFGVISDGGGSRQSDLKERRLFVQDLSWEK